MERNKFTHKTERDLKMLTFEIVRLIESDAKLIMDWRNDPHTLEMSFHSKPKIWTQFWHDFSVEYFSIPELLPLFVIKDGIRVAILRFRRVDETHLTSKSNRRCCEISINVSPEFRGRGIGTLVLKEINSWIKQQGYDDVYADIKNNNAPSFKAFSSASYQDLGCFEKIVEGAKVSYRRFIKRLTPFFAFDQNVFIIAEVGSNWRMGSPKHDLSMAYALIDVAVEAGADAVKFQAFHTESVYVKNAGKSHYLLEKGNSEDISAIFQDLQMIEEMIPLLSQYCQNLGIEFMSSSFSEKDFFIVDPYVKYHKIASYEITHTKLIKLAAGSGKPLILSTGASTEEEIGWALDVFFKNGGCDVTLLQCTAKYPADAGSMNLNTIASLRDLFHVRVGLSDHSRDPFTAPIAAVALGACVIEKHFTLSNALPGPDHSFALLPHELKDMVNAIRNTEKMLGSRVKCIFDEEQELRSFATRGLQAICNIQKGDVFADGVNIEVLRPGNQRRGVHPKLLTEIEGHRANREIPLGDGILYGDWD